MTYGRRHYIVYHLCFSPDSTLLAYCIDSDVAVLGVSSARKIADLRGHDGAVCCLNFSNKGDRIVTGSGDNTVRVWNALPSDIPDEERELVILREHSDQVSAVLFSPDDALVISASEDSTLVTCNSFSGEKGHIFLGKSPASAMAYSNSGVFVAAGYADGGVRLWEAKTGTFIAEYEGHTGRIRSVAFTPNDEDIISSSEDGTVRGWNVYDTLRLY